MDADDHVNTQLRIITVIKEKLSDYYYSNFRSNNNKVKYISRP